MKLLHKTLLLSFFILLSVTNVYSQLAMGKWRTHIAYNTVEQIAQSENKIYAVSEGALFSVTKDDGNIESYNKFTGLTDSEVSEIEFDKTNQQLLIVYANGNIDLLSANGVSNLPDFFNKQLSSNKNVNDVQFYNDKAYLSCAFGILVINLKKKEVADTYYIGANASDVNVLNLTILNDKIYALSANQIYYATASSPNLVNYEYWKILTDLPGIGNFQKIITYNEKLLLLRGNSLYLQVSDGNWEQKISGINFKYLNISNGKIILKDLSEKIYLVNSDFTYSTISTVDNVADAEFDSNTGTLWFAANTRGVVSYQNTSNTPVINTYKPAGPAVNSPWSMTFSGQKLIVVPGARWDIQYQKPGIIMIYENGVWTNIYDTDIKSVTSGPVLDFMNTAIDPENKNHFFVSSYGNGLFEFRNNHFYKWFTFRNSTIETIVPDDPYNYMRLDGAVFDKNGNLFVCNMGLNSGIKFLQKSDSSWHQLTYPEAAKPTFGQMLISNQNPNQKWIPSVRYTPGIFIFDDGGTLTNQADDKSVFLSSFNDTDNDGSTIAPGYFYCLAQDKNGVIWAGTEQGPLLFYNTNNAFSQGYTCTRVKIPRNNGTIMADYLLLSEHIKCIAIDGANRKWIGTESSGAYLMSENGQETIHHFTANNSPILSDNILSIAINPVTGEVFFGTSQGLISYQSDASEGEETFTDVHAYPNPVRENYSGPITITGLVENTQIKITDITGNLIFETTSKGSLATWNGNDLRGKRVSTGIYLVIGVTSDGTQSTITKILVIN